MEHRNNPKRRFRPRQQKNGFRRRSNGPVANGSNHFQGNSGTSGNFSRNGSMTNPFNVEKTMQKYLQLAKDATTSGDPVLSENYMQHAEHYNRRLTELNVKPKEANVSVETDKDKNIAVDLATDIKEEKKEADSFAEALAKKSKFS